MARVTERQRRLLELLARHPANTVRYGMCGYEVRVYGQEHVQRHVAGQRLVAATVDGLVKKGMVKRCHGINSGYEISNAGRTVLGRPHEEKPHV